MSEKKKKTDVPKKDENMASKSDEMPQLSKAEMKRLRREKQEAQRAAKAASKQPDVAVGDKQPQKPKPLKPAQNAAAAAAKVKEDGPKKKSVDIKVPPLEKSRKSDPTIMRVPDQLCADVEKSTKRLEKKLQKQQVPQRQTSQRKVLLFSHLPQFVKEQALTETYQFNSSIIHPVILALGVKYAQGIICGSNARCVALLAAFKQVIKDYSTPNHKDLARDLDAKLKPNISFLSQCRPLSVSMGNAIKHVKSQINKVPAEMPEPDAKQKLFKVIDDFVNEKIVLARQAIAEDFMSKKKIQDGDVILVYGYSSLVKYVLCVAHKREKKFRVIITDSRPKLEGRQMLKQLVQAGIECSYVYITAVSYVMQEVTKVLLGAHALLSNGFVMSRVGTSQVALVAKAYNVPVMVCCETYKFSDNVQTDSFVSNELADPKDLIKSSPFLGDWESLKSLNLLNLVYDVTPPDLVAAVVTELGMIPCTSVPVVLRVNFAGMQE